MLFDLSKAEGNFLMTSSLGADPSAGLDHRGGEDHHLPVRESDPLHRLYTTFYLCMRSQTMVNPYLIDTYLHFIALISMKKTHFLPRIIDIDILKYIVLFKRV
jgi:hypothetical protein